MSTTYDWEGAYRAAMLETDNRVLAKRIHDARTAINERMNHLNSVSPEDHEESQAISDAGRNLDILSRELNQAPAKRNEIVRQNCQ